MATNPIAIFDVHESPEDYFLADTVYKASYARLAKLAEHRNIDLRFITGIKNYSKGMFTSSWKYVGDEFSEIQKPFKAQTIFLKTRTSLLDAEKRVNSQYLEKVCRDKYLTYQTFPNLVKKTVLLTDTSLNSLTGESVVIKPRYGSQGDKVQLIKKADFTALITDDEYIAQELIDTSKGIPELINSRHELRIYVFNGKLQSAYLRIPAENSFLTNISQGATVKQLDNNEIPESAFEVTKSIDAEFSNTKARLYTIDLMYENGRPWVVELNDMPGLPNVIVQPLADNFFNALLDLLVAE